VIVIRNLVAALVLSTLLQGNALAKDGNEESSEPPSPERTRELTERLGGIEGLPSNEDIHIPGYRDCESNDSYNILNFAFGKTYFLNQNFDSLALNFMSGSNPCDNDFNFSLEFGYSSSSPVTQDDELDIGIITIEGENGTERHLARINYVERLLSLIYLNGGIAANLDAVLSGNIRIEVSRFELGHLEERELGLEDFSIPTDFNINFYVGLGMRLGLDLYPLSFIDNSFTSNLGLGFTGEISPLINAGEPIADEGINLYTQYLFNIFYRIKQ